MNKPNGLMRCEYQCGACGSHFSFEATLHELSGNLKAPCPLCRDGATLMIDRDIPPNATGTYRFSKALNRVVKVSDRVSSSRGSGTCAPGACGGGCG